MVIFYLEDTEFPDRTIYQLGYWLVSGVAENTNSNFNELFFKNMDFWHSNIKAIRNYYTIYLKL